MALFKMFNNIDSKNTTLPNTYTKGYMYYDVKDSIFYIDIDGTGGTTGTRQKINAWGAEKSLKDSLNQQIDATYIKGISISNNQLSYTLGDGTSHTVEGTLGAVTGVKGNAETTYRTGQINLTPENIGAATSGHTHTTTIATDSGTNQLTLAFGTKYKLTAGGTSYIFTMPANPDTNTASAVDNILDGSNSGTAITYAPYTSQQTKLSFDTSTTNPTRTDRLNLNGYLYATKLYSGGKEVLTAHQSLSNYKTKQTAVSSATAETSTATTFVYSVTQNDNGEITVKTRPLPTYNNYTLPTATTSTKGGVIIGSNINVNSDGKISIDANSVTAALGYTPYSSSNPNGYTSNTGTITGIKMNGSSKGTSGIVDLGTVITAHQDISGKANINSPNFTGSPTAPTPGSTSSTSAIATKGYVDNAFAANDAMIFKGGIDGQSTSPGSFTPLAQSGWTYKVSTAGYINGIKLEVGDMLICTEDNTAAATSSNYSTINSNWLFIESNNDGYVIGPASSTANHIATFTGTTGKVIKDSGFTIGTSVPANAVFTDTNKYHKTGSWSGLTYTAQAVNSADELKFTIPSATTSAAGAVQLSSATNSTSETLAATAKAVKAAYDLAASKTSNTGTVTSVAASGSGGITISGSPITTSGTLSIGLNLNTAINGLSEGSSTPVDADYYVSQYVGGGTSTTTYHRRPMSALYDYIKGKLAVTNNTINLSRNTETTIATIAGTPIKIKLPASDNTWRGVQNNLTSDATDQSLSAAQGKALANGSARDSTKLPLTGGSITGGLEIKGHIAGDNGTSGHGLYSGGGYHNAYNNIILHGDATTGTSGIAFISDKGATSINQPSDRAFIQWHAMGVTTYTTENTAPTLGTSGEANTLIIGVGNDAADKVRIQTPGRTGLLHQVGNTGYVIPDTNNTTGTAGSGTQPVWVDEGVIKNTTYTLGKSVPSNAVFTDMLVKQTAKTDSVEYKILTTTSASPTSGGAAEAAYSAGVTLNPSTNTLTASHFQAEHISGGNNEFRVTYGNTVDMSLMVGGGDENHGIYDWKASKWMVYADGSGNVTLNGNAETATKATQDESGNNIKASYASSFSISDHTITLKNKNGVSLGTVTIPDNNTDTKNTAGSTDTSSKIFLIGATSQAANPQTYSDNQVYATNGQLDANKIRIAEQVSLVFNSTTNALDFVFA